MIQFSISTDFSSVWHIDRTLSGATTPGKSGPGSVQWMGIPHSPKVQYYWSLTIRLFSVISRILIGEWALNPLQRSSQCILQPQPTWRQRKEREKKIIKKAEIEFMWVGSWPLSDLAALVEDD